MTTTVPIRRSHARAPDALRPISIELNALPNAEGSAYIKVGDTHVICSATVDEHVPRWMKGKGTGWVTAEYAMLPRSTSSRTRREAVDGKQGGRTVEIQRLIGRALRTVIDLGALGERQIILDCDVIRADGERAAPRSPAPTSRWRPPATGWCRKSVFARTRSRRRSQRSVWVWCGACRCLISTTARIRRRMST